MLRERYLDEKGNIIVETEFGQFSDDSPPKKSSSGSKNSGEEEKDES
jgi:hypothetical protein